METIFGTDFDFFTDLEVVGGMSVLLRFTIGILLKCFRIYYLVLVKLRILPSCITPYFFNF